MLGSIQHVCSLGVQTGAGLRSRCAQLCCPCPCAPWSQSPHCQPRLPALACEGPGRHLWWAGRGWGPPGSSSCGWVHPLTGKFLISRFLCLKNKSSASVVFTTYTQKHPSIESGPPFVQPLLNFIWFLLLAVEG